MHHSASRGEGGDQPDMELINLEPKLSDGAGV